nr:PepSY domain-containing protein [uncultured Sphingomonas sp.]
MRTLWTLPVLGILAATATPALADRAPTPSERAAVERVLQRAGFVSWEEIELDDDGPLWEVDDARTRAGLRYDLKIDPRTLRIVKRERDR